MKALHGKRQTPDWDNLIATSAAPVRARGLLQQLQHSSAAEKLRSLSEAEAKTLVTILSASPALAQQILSEPGLLEVLGTAEMAFRRRKEGLAREVADCIGDLARTSDFAGALARIREFKNRSTLRIAARDLCRLSSLPELIGELSDVADVCLEGFYRVILIKQMGTHGQPWHQEADGSWHETHGCVLGMGKLGGQELNYSSDVDVLFAYTAEGSVFRTPPKARVAPLSAKSVMTNNSFFNRFAETFIEEVSRLTPAGFLYRIDLRLRPEGVSGSLSRSLNSYENFYSQWGQTWERMMLMKSRGVAGYLPLGLEFNEMIQPFCYPRSLQHDILGEVAAMKDRIENEVVKTGELERNVKLGQGGIREIEFIVQSQQLLHGGHQPFLRGFQTLPGLAKLAQYGLLPPKESEDLASAYVFLRDTEHRLQVEENRQTHTIPHDAQAQERLARLMGFASLTEFVKNHQSHRLRVRTIFQRLFRAEKSIPKPKRPFPPKLVGFESEWKQFLIEHGFRDVDKSFRMVREFVEGPGYVHVSTRTEGIALELFADRFFSHLTARESHHRAAGDTILPETFPLSDPDRVMTRLDSFISAYGARTTLFELWNRNPGIFTLLVKLFDRSEFLAGLAITIPDMVDELVTSGRLQQRKTAAETLADLRHGLGDADQILWLRKYHHAEFMRIGLRDILGLADPEQYLVELSALADACLQYALEIVLRKNKVKKAPFAIIGLGKLGGVEIDYGSDLDILFVADSRVKNVAGLAPMAREVMELLSRRTDQGILFPVDARLRPDGEKGLLVNTLSAYESYYRQRAELWEIQTLTRTRFITGNKDVGFGFQELAAAITNFHQPKNPPAAFVPEWKQKIRHMRMRIQKERTPNGLDHLAIKTGSGGLIDAEFIAQALCLENGWQEANTLRLLVRACEAGVLKNSGNFIESYRQLRGLEGVLRRWSYEGETVLPEDAEALTRVAIRAGFTSSQSLLLAIKRWRANIRKVFLRFFKSGL